LSGLILEGVTGAGKSSTIAELATIATFKRFDEDATFEDFMGDLARDRQVARSKAVERLNRVLDAASAADSQHVLFERFHFSCVALDGEWEPYDSVDRRCAEFGVKVVLLTIPQSQLAARSLYRAEYNGRDWQGFLERYGSEASALEELEQSQRRRIEALRRSRLEHLRIETAARDWPLYARQIAQWTLSS
jgi:thymidylate kinase